MSDLRYKSSSELRRMKDTAGQYWHHSNVLLRWAKDDEVRAIEDEQRRRRVEEERGEEERREERRKKERAEEERRQEEELIRAREVEESEEDSVEDCDEIDGR